MRPNLTPSDLSVPPPSQPEPPPGAGEAPEPAAVLPEAGAADAAVRWRVRAAILDNILVYVVYLLLCAIFHWQVRSVSRVWILLVLGVVYHLVLEARDGQTVGKRRYGIRVVRLVDGGRAGVRAVAIRSVLRAVDALPVLYVSGLITMMITGKRRRQRIGDRLAGTTVVAVDRFAAQRGTSRRYLPVVTAIALAASALAVYSVATVNSRPLSSDQRAAFIRGCERSPSSALIDCTCLLNQLVAQGYNSIDSLQSLENGAQAELAAGQQGADRQVLATAALTCRRGPVRLIDLSAPIRPDSTQLPELIRTDITYEDHAAGARTIQTLFGVGPELLRDGEGWAVEQFDRLGTHNTTHVDAPWHYNSNVAGERARTIDELPLDWFFAPGVVIEATEREDGEALEVGDVRDRLPRELAPRDIVLVHTGRDAYYGQPDYMARGPGVSAAATLWLWEQGVRVMGIDAWGWDAPLHLQAQQALASGERGIFWAAHQVGRPYSQIERLVNLGALPPEGFTVACFPLRLVGGSAAPARVVAILE